MATAGTKMIATALGNAMVEATRHKGSTWYTPHMEAASRAIAERMSLVDFILEVRDARIPSSSQFHLLKNYPPASCHPRRIIVFNKKDLTNPPQLEEWTKYFEQLNCISYGVNSHNKVSVKEFLDFLQAQVREMKKTDHSGCTATMMIVGIPNVGKSALANSLHQIGRISAAEKGKLKHVTVSPYPGETKDISSLKIGSHPNIYLLDTPGVLPPEILDLEVCSKLALTGSIRDCLVGENELAKYFLSVLNMSDEYKKWEKLASYCSESLEDHKAECLSGSGSVMKRKRQHLTDHTQDLIVNDVRRCLYEAISCFDGDVQNERDMEKLIEVQFTALREAFKLTMGSREDGHVKVATKLLNLYRTGRLGRYTLDSFDM